MKLLFILPLLSVAVCAQVPDAKPKNASINGTVRDKLTGKPLPNYTVSTYVNATFINNGIVMNSATKDVASTTDDSGRYKLNDLPPGFYRVQARPAQSFSGTVTRSLTMAGQDLDNIDFQISLPGSLSGRVVDENQEPIPNMTVLAASREYYLGNLGYFLKSSARTNDRGEFRFDRVDPGKAYLLVAEKRELKLPAHSDTPLNPKMRRPVPMRTWYPNSADKDGAAPIVLQSGEARSGVVISVKKSPSYCAEGVITTPNGPVAMTLQVEALRPSSGTSSSGGNFFTPPTAQTGPDGKFRVCDLYPGGYRLTAVQFPAARNQPVSQFAVISLDITDRDVAGLQIATGSGIDVEGEIVLEGPPPASPITARPSFSLSSLFRPVFGQENLGGRYDIPSKFVLNNLLIDDYFVRTNLTAPGLYVKDVTYGGRSVLYEPLRPGTAIGDTGIRVIIAQDGATLSAQVSDKDGKPVADKHIILIPDAVPSEGVLAARMVSAQTDQLGKYKSQTLPPGKYYVAATEKTFDATLESIRDLWQARVRFTEVTLPPGGEAQIKLQPLD